MEKLINIGESIREQLLQVDIDSFDRLKSVGSKKAWLKIKAIDDSACYNRLCALEGAIRGIKKTDLPKDIKEELKLFYNQHK